MPRYDFECRDCGHTFEGVSRMDDRHSVVCPKCGGATDILMSTSVNIIGDMEPYYDRGMGEWITSRSDRRTKMKLRGLQEGHDESTLREARDTLGEYSERKRSKRH